MRIIERAKRTGLNSETALLLVLGLMLTVLHQADHVLRVDHSGWPFRRTVNPFTVSLLAYPVILFALLGTRRQFWWRWLFLALATVSTMYAHIMIESPFMQYAMWANDCSLDPRLSGLQNMLRIRSPALGVVSVLVGMALNLTAVAATFCMLTAGLKRRHELGTVGAQDRSRGDASSAP